MPPCTILFKFCNSNKAYYNVNNIFWHSMKCHQISIECNVYHQKLDSIQFKDFCTFYRLVISWSKIRLTYFTTWPKSSFRLSSVSSKMLLSFADDALARHPIFPIIANPNTGVTKSVQNSVSETPRTLIVVNDIGEISEKLANYTFPNRSLNKNASNKSCYSAEIWRH